MSEKARNTVFIIGVLLLILIGVGWSANKNADNSVTNNETVIVETQDIVISDDGRVVTYQGVAGETALATLQNGAEVTTETSDFGEFVTTINGVEADANGEFWAFYVNGELAAVGASAYTTEDGDIIEWRLESF